MSDKGNPKARRERKFRKPKATRVSKGAVKLLNNSAYGSDEPEAVDFSQVSQAVLIRALNHYNAVCDVSDARKWTAEFLKDAEMFEEASAFKKLPDTHVSLALGWCCRLLCRGAVLPENEMAFLQRKLAECLEGGPIEHSPQAPKQGRTAAEKARDKLSDILGEVEGMIDDSDGVEPVDLYKWLVDNDVPPTYCAAIVAKLNPRFEELREVYTGSADKQLEEGYRHLSSQEIKLQATIISVMIGDAARYAHDKRPVRKERKERKPKAVSPEKRVQYLRYKHEDADLSLKSVRPETVLGARELWCFNPKYRLLTVYRAYTDEGLDIHRSSISSASLDVSRSQTLRIKKKFVRGALDAVYYATETGRANMLEGDPMPLQARINAETLLLRVVR